MAENIKYKTHIVHFIVYHISIVMILGVMSFLIYPPDFPKTVIEPVHASNITKSKRMKKIDGIRALLQSELLLKPELAKEISVSIYNHTNGTAIMPELVVAVMKIESHGRPNAVSSAGAMGLMQVMPFWKKVMKMEDADLFDADTNIKMGVNVLHRYINRYKKLERALAAYNGSLGSSRYPKKVLKVYKKIVRINSNEA